MSDLLNYQENLFSYQLDCERGEGAAGLLEENEINAGCSDLMLRHR